MASLTVEKKEAHNHTGGTIEYWLGTYTTDEGVVEEYAAATQEKILSYFSRKMIEYRQAMAREALH